jgi:hypothetical protein
MTPSSIPPRGASVEDLRAEAEHAAERVLLCRRKVRLGRGDPRRLAELERVSSGAAGIAAERAQLAARLRGRETAPVTRAAR